ncbi:MAG: hypothetical protein LBG58_00315 [Planctomycetaceae bacterium]|jgi:hypothetical protein|nr:hypothetical protein [Planctomycetaceae bacterium]
MLKLNDISALEFEIYNKLSDKRITVKTMLLSAGISFLKIPRKIPLWDGVLMVVFHRKTSLIEIKHQSVFGSFFGEQVLDNIDCLEFESLNMLVDCICEKIYNFYHCSGKPKSFIVENEKDKSNYSIKS